MNPDRKVVGDTNNQTSSVEMLSSSDLESPGIFSPDVIASPDRFSLFRFNKRALIITTSAVPGVGAKLSGDGEVVGQALEAFDPTNGQGTAIACPAGHLRAWFVVRLWSMSTLIIRPHRRFSKTRTLHSLRLTSLVWLLSMTCRSKRKP